MTHILTRRDNAATWAAENPVLMEGERGHEKDTRKSKTGDGVTAWNDLDYEIADVVVTKDDIGLDQVDNTSDLDKPISSATAAALAGKASTSSLAAKANLASPHFTGFPEAPTQPLTDDSTNLATTGFVNDLIDYRMSDKQAVKVAATGNIVLSGPQTLDGVAALADDRVLVAFQTTKADNGIYIVKAGAWVRAEDADDAQLIAAASVHVKDGTQFGGARFATTFKSSDTLGTTDMNWYQIGRASVYQNLPGTHTLTAAFVSDAAVTLQPGRWTVIGKVGFAYSTASVRIYTAELYDGAVTRDVAEASTVTNGAQVLSLLWNADITVATTVQLRTKTDVVDGTQFTVNARLVALPG